MSATDIVRASFDAYLAQDRAAADRLLAEDLVFTSPQDDHIDRATFLERCFPTADRLRSQEIVELVGVGEHGVFILYEYELKTGERHRNTEFITVRDEQIVEIQVFFGGRVLSAGPIHIEAPFTIDVWDMVADDPGPGGPETARVVLRKTYTGPMLTAGAGGHALTTQGPEGASYVAQERIVGALDGREGSFVLEHRASMGEGHPTVMAATVVPGSGTGALKGITGSGKVRHELLTLDVELPPR